MRKVVSHTLVTLDGVAVVDAVIDTIAKGDTAEPIRDLAASTARSLKKPK